MLISKLDITDEASNLLKVHVFEYERVWSSGEKTNHVMEIEAFGRSYAETMFLYKLDNPKDLSSERVLEITVKPLKALQ